MLRWIEDGLLYERATGRGSFMSYTFSTCSMQKPWQSHAPPATPDPHPLAT